MSNLEIRNIIVNQGGGSLTDEDKKFIKDIKEILERIEKKDVGERIIEVTKVERIVVPSVDNSLITDVVIEGLADIREELLDTMVESISEIKNKK